MLFCSKQIFVLNYFFKNLSVIPSVSKGLDSDQAWRFGSPDLGPNCLKKVISSQQKSPLAGKEIMTIYIGMLWETQVQIWNLQFLNLKLFVLFQF